jgi:hypothetical protein
MKYFPAHLWLMVLGCVAMGLMNRVVLANSPSLRRRPHPFDQHGFDVFLCFQVIWYATALLLFLAHVCSLGTGSRPRKEVPGCWVVLLWVVGVVFVFLVLVWFSLLAD